MLVDPDKLLLDPNKHPSFCKLLFKEGFMDKILIPPVFIKEHKKMLAKACLLKTDITGMPWEAKIVRENSNFFICEGDWSQFVVYHKLELGCLLLFYLVDKSTFQVLPYTQKCCTNIRGRQLLEELSSEEEEEEKNIRPSRKSGKVKTEPKGPSNPEEESVDPSSGSKYGVNLSCLHSVDSAKLLLDPDKHPYFCTLLFKEGFMDKTLMPPAFINEHKKMLAKTCLLKTGVEMLWEAKIVRERSNFFICEGDWSQFVVYHKLELGDILLFFLIGRSTFQVLPYTQKCYRNLRGRQLFEELSNSSEEEEDTGPSRKSNKLKMEPKEPSNSEEESVDPSSGSKDGENPGYSFSGVKSGAEADNMLSLKKRAKGQSRLIKYVKDPDKLKRPASTFVMRERRPAIAFSVSENGGLLPLLSEHRALPMILTNLRGLQELSSFSWKSLGSSS
ncbi:putative B3 domain-containing protein Os04g0347400 [Lycium ferocissimum]|uniref:putative B3 domain-containing protein Os04g0347400 n=1 Tax=Lycium ferocissimum TaxID=112874 RepID=UPI00281508DE|nr:putative B3 domain-containing protein Os04g0347400 [Lycium ferocissimum]